MQTGLDLPGPDRPLITEEQRRSISQLREAVRDILDADHDEYFLYRWLKARNFDMDKAERMLRSSLEWRKAYGADGLLKDWNPPEVLRKFWPGGVYGFDKEGHPILWQISKNFDAPSMLRCAKKSDIVKYHIYRTERIMKISDEQTKKLGKRVGKAVHISDLDGFTLKMAFAPGIVGMMKHIFSLTEANYPERLHSSYVINAPGVFPLFFNLLKPLLSEDTKKKVHVLGRNWQEEVLKVIDRDQLPVHWGGTAMDPDEFCSNHITQCLPIPESFYQAEKVPLDRGKMTRATVLRGLAYHVDFYVRIPNSVIRWVFETDEYDISFGIYRYDLNKAKDPGQIDPKDMEEVLPSTRLNCNIIPEDGVIRCMKPGIYVLRFDNTYSWVTSKKVYYEAELLEPEKDPLFSAINSVPTTPSAETTPSSVEATPFFLESTHL